MPEKENANTLLDLGQKHAQGMGHPREAHQELKADPKGFFGSFSAQKEQFQSPQ